MTTYILIAHFFFNGVSGNVATALYDTHEQCMTVASDVARSAPALAQRAIFITWECAPVVAP